jgi:hypothetical protein
MSSGGTSIAHYNIMIIIIPHHSGEIDEQAQRVPPLFVQDLRKPINQKVIANPDDLHLLFVYDK